MTVLKHVVVLVLLAVTVISEEPTSFDPTTEKVPSTEPELACSCLPCSGNSDFYTVHTQSHFCDSAAVIQGRVTQKEVHKTATGLWLQKEHTDHFRRGFPPTHFELTVRVLAIYSNRGDSKLSVGDKITVRYAKTSYCPQCQIKVESFHDESWTDRDLQRGEKYVFFLPILKDGYGDKPEAALSQCTRVWRYSKRGKMIEGWVPLVQRYMLSTTSCDKCRVSGCFQNKCVKVEDDEGCDDPRSVTSQWRRSHVKLSWTVDSVTTTPDQIRVAGPAFRIKATGLEKSSNTVSRTSCRMVLSTSHQERARERTDRPPLNGSLIEYVQNVLWYMSQYHGLVVNRKSLSNARSAYGI